MRIAICLSGQFRVLKAAMDLFKRQLPSDHEYDYYIHTWRTNAPTERNLKLEYEVTEDLVRQFFSPINLIIEEQKTFDLTNFESKVLLPSKIQTCLSMYYSIEQSVKLCKDKEYDCVIRYRTDSLFFNPIVIPKELDYLWVIGDCFAISSQENMLQYAKIYDNFPRLFRRCEYEIGFPEAFINENAKLYYLPLYALNIKHDLGRDELDCQNKMRDYDANNRR